MNFAVHQAIYEQTFHEPRYRPQRLQAQMVAAGLLGQKSGAASTATPTVSACAEEETDPYAEIGPLEPRGERADRRAGAVADDLALALQGARARGRHLFDRGIDDADGRGHPARPPPARCAADDDAGDRGMLGPRDLKRAYWYELDESLPPQIPILSLALGQGATELGSWAPRPERVAGIGYAGPFATRRSSNSDGAADERVALRRAIAFLRGLGKEVTVVGDPPGQVLTRLLSCLVNEAAFALDEGIASPDDIDTAMRLGLNYPAGPIEWSVRLGLDRVVTTLDGLHAYYGEDRYRVAPRLRRALHAGRAGLE